MNRITGISLQKKNKDRVNIEIEGEYAFSLYAETAVRYGIAKDKEISDEEIERCRREDSQKFAFELSLHYLSYKARTTKEVIDYLKNKEIDDQSILYAIEKLKEYRYLDDVQYADDYVKYYQSNPRYGARMLEYKLIQKGISSTIAKEACARFEKEEEGKIIEELVRKAKRKYTGLHPQKQREKIYRLLISKGFDYDKIKAAWQSEPEDDIEE